MSQSAATQDALGLACLVASGSCITATVVASRLFDAWRWPTFRVNGLIALGVVLGATCTLAASGGRRGLWCPRPAAKWVVARGTCGCLQFTFAVLAALAGAPVGDISALGSVNVVVAALCGRLFLGERLGGWHVAAIACSVAGAVLISDPAALGHGGGSWLGFLLALLSGTLYGLIFICARKITAAGGASDLLMTVSALGQRCVVLWVLAALPLAGRVNLASTDAEPGEVAAAVALGIVVTFLGTHLANIGSKLCPAAVSATVTTATNMFVGYAAQIGIFGERPHWITVSGAGLMLAAVVMVAAARLPRRSRGPQRNVGSLEEAQNPPQPLAGQGGACTAAAPAEEESLGSFIASEFAEEQRPRLGEAAIRQRAPAATLACAAPAAVQLGAMAVVASG